MTDKKSNDSRRKLLKSIAAGSGAVVAGKSLPESWSKPIIDTVMLPAHAELTDDSASAALTNKSFYRPPGETLGMVEPVNESSNALFDAFISPAMARPLQTQVSLGMLITLSEVGGKVVANSEHLNKDENVKYSATNIPTDGTIAPLSFETSCHPNRGGYHTHIKIVDYSFNANTVTVEITVDGHDRGLSTRTQIVPLGTGTVTLSEC